MPLDSAHADKIVMMHQGAIVEMGSHDDFALRGVIALLRQQEAG